VRLVSRSGSRLGGLWVRLGPSSTSSRSTSPTSSARHQLVSDQIVGEATALARRARSVVNFALMLVALFSSSATATAMPDASPTSPEGAQSTTSMRAEVHHRAERVARERGRLADDLVRDPVGGAQERSERSIESWSKSGRGAPRGRPGASPGPAPPASRARPAGRPPAGGGKRPSPPARAASRAGTRAGPPHGHGQHEHERGEPAPPRNRATADWSADRRRGRGRRHTKRREEGRDEEVELVEQTGAAKKNAAKSCSRDTRGAL